jgi:hypothetical protein
LDKKQFTSDARPLGHWCRSRLALGDPLGRDERFFGVLR